MKFTDFVITETAGNSVDPLGYQFVHQGARLPSVWTQLQGQIYLGSESFIQNMQVWWSELSALFGIFQ